MGLIAGRVLDEIAIGELYREHGPAVFRKCLALSGGNVAWAEDATHDVFMRLLEHQDEVDAARNVGGWLRTVAFRLCLDRLRHERTIWSRIKAKLTAAVPDQPHIDPESALRIKGKMQRASALLQNLSPKERAVVVMRYIDDLPQHEMARILGWSEGYVSKVLKRASARLRQAGWEVTHD